MLDSSGKPTLPLQASVLREELEDRLPRLQYLERWIKQNAGSDDRERRRADSVADAIEHLQRAIDALGIASQE